MDFLRQNSENGKTGMLRKPVGIAGRLRERHRGYKRAAVFLCLFLLAFCLACGSKKAEKPEARDSSLPIQWLEVSVMYKDGSFLPAGSVLTLTLEDVSVADAPAGFVGETVLEVEGEPPYAVSLGYNPELIKEGGSYSLRAQIRHYERLLYTNATAVDPFEKKALEEKEAPEKKEGSNVKRGPETIELLVIRVPRHPDKDKQGKADARGAEGARP